MLHRLCGRLKRDSHAIRHLHAHSVSGVTGMLLRQRTELNLVRCGLRYGFDTAMRGAAFWDTRATRPQGDSKGHPSKDEVSRRALEVGTIQKGTSCLVGRM